MRARSNLTSILAFTGALCAFGVRGPAQASEPSESLWGRWVFSQMLYQGELRPIPNPKLVLTFEFRPDGTDHLHWSRVGEDGSCEREGRYHYDGHVLHDEVIRVEPKNLPECARDPDMVLGHVSETPMVRVGAQLEMNLGLGDEPLFYIFEPVPLNGDLWTVKSLSSLGLDR